ncbi:DNA methylase N-4/N-6 domain protein [Acidithiobacillus ferrivorans]|uniref:site-specific DNA-methyltransferase (adenine-specific) n=1 Tax=Acidithiobacillus ferrivorans TaxID=160808 RepID=A0A060UUZ4_9PROT|nr:site-specific DNA-methyltransferase [Acidithiobacillus ferrivorans]CDQ12240.1 DNA methylase N-4/N-6 domain protein [Acidithiobacillus ferrivorans]SMH65216.1 DNA methylase N-4/N-6 domain protein [Acidithiobacillus ferrivorans]
MAKSPKPSLTIETLTHDEATRKNIPTAEYQAVMRQDEQKPVRVEYPRQAAGLEDEKRSRNPDLDPQLIWRGKDRQDWSSLVVQAPPLYIQEKVHPKVLIDDLRRFHARNPASGAARQEDSQQIDLFADFNGLPDANAKTEFYQHDAHWANRMILGDSLQVMASLAEREGLRGQVQCIYFDPPYGIKFNSNFQWSTTSRDVKDGNTEHITREPEQVKAFRDTWRDGIHSYLTYLRDRLTVARDLLTESGSIFVQIGDENVHRIRALMDEVFGDENFCATITFAKNSGATDELLSSPNDYVLWFAKDKAAAKYRRVFQEKVAGTGVAERYKRIRLADGTRRQMTESEAAGTAPLPVGAEIYTEQGTYSAGFRANTSVPFTYQSRTYDIGRNKNWKTHLDGMARLGTAGRLIPLPGLVYYERRLSDFPVSSFTTLWLDTQDRLSKRYVVETVPRVIERCILMATDPGDLVLDPTCGSGTTAYVAEQWGRRWITLDTSRVALALARARIMGARYPYYLLADSPEGQQKEAAVTRSFPSGKPTYGSIRHGFVCERVPHITLKSIANNAEIDVIWEQWQPAVSGALADLNTALKGHKTLYKVPTGGRQGQFLHFDAPEGRSITLPGGETVSASALLDWEVPRDAPADWPVSTHAPLAGFWQARIARQQAIDASIAAKADFEYLYDKPYEDKKKVRVAGPFTVESLSPHRVLGVDENDELIDPNASKIGDQGSGYGEERDFAQIILENLKTAGVQQAHKDGKINFTALTPWPGELVCADGRYLEPAGPDGGSTERRAAIFVGPEFGTVSRPDLVAAAREAADAGFDVLIACAFNYDAHASEFDKLGRVPVLKARMNADLHMANDLKNTGKGNLFVIFGEPDIDILDAKDGQIRVKVNGVDVFHPNSGEVHSDGPDGIACWFIDTDYNEESFFVRQAYFLGANDPYKSLKTTLKAEIDAEAWATLNSDTSRAFDKPATGRIAVKVINHLGDEVMKVFRVA